MTLKALYVRASNFGRQQLEWDILTYSKSQDWFSEAPSPGPGSPGPVRAKSRGQLVRGVPGYLVPGHPGAGPWKLWTGLEVLGPGGIPLAPESESTPESEQELFHMKCIRSRAYHKALLAAKRAGLSPDECKVKAREAFRAAV